VGIIGPKTHDFVGPGALWLWARRGYRKVMKPYAIAAALALLPASPVLAQLGTATPVQTPPASLADSVLASASSDKSKLLNEIEAWRATKLPHVVPPAPITARFEPRLDEIKAQALDASDGPALDKPRKDFESWKKDVLRRMYGDAKAEGLTKETFSQFSGEENIQAQFSAALNVQMAQFAATRALADRQRTAVSAFASNPYRFDGEAVHYGDPGAASDPSAVTAPAPLDANDPARYAKVRQILISQGARPRVVDLAIKEAMRQNADPLLVLAVIKQESGFKTNATSGVGARGLMQIMPDTGRGLGVRNSSLLYDAQTNLRAGISFLKSLWGQFVGGSMSAIEDMNPWSSHDVKAAVAAYNAGPGAVRKYNGVPPYRETQGYVKSVLGYYEQFKQYLDA
jgi:soluble lytic murein transglycosylase-like protein